MKTYNQAQTEFKEALLNNDDVKRLANYYDKSIDLIVSKLRVKIKVLKYEDKTIKKISINCKDEKSNILVKEKINYQHHETLKQNTQYLAQNIF